MRVPRQTLVILAAAAAVLLVVAAAIVLGALASEGRYGDRTLATYVRASRPSEADRPFVPGPEVREPYLRLRLLVRASEDGRLPAATRRSAAAEAVALAMGGPLPGIDVGRLTLLLAQLTEEAGAHEEAAEHYAAALPAQSAVSGLARTVADPEERAALLLEAGLAQEALYALGHAAVPRLDARAYRVLGRSDQAHEAYSAWIEDAPDDPTPRLERTELLLSEGRLDEAEFVLLSLPGSHAEALRGEIAWQRGDMTAALTHFLASDRPPALWKATGLLEAAGRTHEAIAAYLALAAAQAPERDDAAYRAWLLASRLELPSARDRAASLLPSPSWFALRAGRPLELPMPSDRGEEASRASAALARALHEAGDSEFALGELVLAALRDPGAAHVHLETAAELGSATWAMVTAERLLRDGHVNVALWELAHPRAFETEVMEQASAWSVEPALIWAVMRSESRFQVRAVSPAGAEGLMQITPSTWRFLATRLGEVPGDPFEPSTNIRYGTFYVRLLLDRFGGEEAAALAAYNAGPGAVEPTYLQVAGNVDDFLRHLPIAETREYVTEVLLVREAYAHPR